LSKIPAHPQAARGALAAAGSFLIWGLVPLYWKQMQSVAACELIAHRIVWSLGLLAGVLAWQGKLAELRPAFATGRRVGRNLLGSVLLAANWTVYVWAVNSGHILESSLGYFLTPLCNVALGYVVLRERLRPLQWTAIACAAAGVAGLLLGVGHVPWIALSLAGTWSGYGFLKKQSTLSPIAGLTVEALLLFPAAAAVLLWQHFAGAGALDRGDFQLRVLVLSTGAVTAIPLVLFAYGAQRIRLGTLGLLQYLAPTEQFLIGLLVYHEVFDAGRSKAYGLIWCGLVLYTADNLRTQHQASRRAAAA
jgi:chloramphenicol-sensitive protein RarD